MTKESPEPGITRSDRVSDTGLQRLERQLRSGARISDPVLAQWIRRYGEAARRLIERYGRGTSALEKD